VGWARELPTDQQLRIIVHLPESQASSSEAHEIGVALNRYFIISYRARVIALDLKELFRIGRRSLVIGLTVLSLCVIAGQTAAANLTPRPVGRVIEESLTISGGLRIGGQSKFFSTSGGRSCADAICIDGFQRPKSN
jgi:hypothetical protein